MALHIPATISVTHQVHYLQGCNQCHIHLHELAITVLNWERLSWYCCAIKMHRFRGDWHFCFNCLTWLLSEVQVVLMAWAHYVVPLSKHTVVSCRHSEHRYTIATSTQLCESCHVCVQDKLYSACMYWIHHIVTSCTGYIILAGLCIDWQV